VRETGGKRSLAIGLLLDPTSTDFALSSILPSVLGRKGGEGEASKLLRPNNQTPRPFITAYSS
jgi:hypothetical protein